jgi:nucleoside permease NupC
MCYLYYHSTVSTDQGLVTCITASSAFMFQALFPPHYLCFVLDLRSLPAILFVSHLMLGAENDKQINRSELAST